MIFLSRQAMAPELPDWASDYLTACERRGIKPKTFLLYKRSLKRFANHCHLNLRSSSEKDILKVLDDYRPTHKISSYAFTVRFTKSILRFWKRDEIADKIPYPRLPDSEGEIKEKLLTKHNLYLYIIVK